MSCGVIRSSLGLSDVGAESHKWRQLINAQHINADKLESAFIVGLLGASWVSPMKIVFDSTHR